MTQEDKQLLLKALCEGLPYGVKGLALGGRDDTISVLVPGEYPWVKTTTGLVCHLGTGQFKPYLRPMSSMTEEEFELLKQYSGLEYDQLDLAEFPNNHKCLDFYLSEVPSYAVILVFDWLNAHHFDYRLLIERGLALEAPEEMYKTE